MRLGLPRLHLRQLGSTSDVARELALAGAPHGALVTAGEQSSGRGRQGRRWTAPAGEALLMSMVLRETSPLLPLAAAVAVARACGPQARIKWPNDVLLDDDRKVAGILVEGRPQERWAVLGIGVNVAVRPGALPQELRATAGTLGRDRGAVEAFLHELLDGLEAALALSDGELLDAWRRRDALAGRDVTWAAGDGIARGIDAKGRLVVELPSGERTTLNAGEVHLGSRRPPG